MKKIKSSKILIRTFIMTLLSLFLLVGVSFAWYYGKISIGGGGLSTGTLGCIVYGYDANGTIKKTVTSSGDNTTVNATIFAHENWKAGDASTAYIAVKRTGNMSVEFNISFSASGYDGALENFMYLGGYWYEIAEITDLMSAKTDAGLKTYAAANKVVLCSETQCPNNKHTCTEKDGLGNYKNMNTILTTKTQGVIKVGDSIQTRYYRIDYGVRKDATPEEYTNKKIELTANVYVTQVGAIQNPDGIGTEYSVSSEADLKQAIINSVPGDTIVFASSFTYTGDLIINKAVNLNLQSRTLTVKGDLIYDFASEHNVKINLSGVGTIKVLANGPNGGNFTLDAPNAQFELIGTNSSGDLIVERFCTLNGTNKPEKGGCILSGITIKDTVNESKEVYLKSDTKVTLNDGCTVKRLEARSQATNIQIVNNGVIDFINLGSMYYSSMTDFPQIYITNYGVINGLVLPTWSEVFTERNGVYSGNTKIVCSMGSTLKNLTEVNGFKASDVIYEGTAVLVESIDGSEERLRVHYRDKGATVTTLEGLLKEYFTSLGYASGALTGCISKITHLEINMLSGKYMTTADSTFINGAFTKLESLNLDTVNLANNTLPTNFITVRTLKEVVLPRNLEVINSTPFGSNVKIDKLSVPETVTNVKSNGLLGVQYAIFQSLAVPNFNKNSSGQATLGAKYVFVPEAQLWYYEQAIEQTLEYDTYTVINGKKPSDWYHSWGYNQYPCYPISTLADDGVSFVKKLDDGTYELVLLDLSANPSLIVDNKYKVGHNLTINGEPITISKIGRYGIFRNIFPFVDISFDDSIREIGLKAMADCEFNHIDFSKIQVYGRILLISASVESIVFSGVTELSGYGPFYSSGARHVDLGTVTKIPSSLSTFGQSSTITLKGDNLDFIGTNSFNECSYLEKVTLPKVTNIRSTVFSKCPKLREVYIPNASYIGEKAFSEDASLIYLNLGDKLATVNVNSLDNTPALKYLYIGSSSTVVTTFNRLKNENPVIDYIFVNANLYNTFKTTIHSSQINSLREYGVASDDYQVNINASGSEPYYLPLGTHTVRISSGSAIITSCNYPKDDFPANYEIPKTVTVNGTNYNVTGIGKRAYVNTNAAPISFNNVTTIDDYAFYNCDNLGLINAPKLTTANTYAFAECDNLISVMMPNAKSWGNYLFYNCPKLSSIYMEKSLTTSNANCISGTTTNIKAITITLDSNTVASSTPFTNIASKNTNLYVLNARLSKYTADATYAKFNVVGINSKITSGSNTYCLSYVSGSTTEYEIVSVSLGTTTLVIPNNQSIVGSRQGAFDGLAVTSITLPNTYKSVREAEFSNVIGLKEILVDSANTNYKSLLGVLYALSETTVKELICYPNSRTGDSYTTDSNTTILSNSAFKNVKYLKTLNVTANVSAIGEACFKNSSMTSITFASTTAPYITSSSVFNTSVTGFKIYVPSDSYKTANGFSKYVEYIVVQ